MATAHRLTNLHLDRIDFVDDGANPGARITLFKRKEAVMAEKETTPGAGPEVAELAKRATEAERQTVELQKRLDEMEKARKADTEELAKMRATAERNAAIEVAKGMGAIAPVDDLAKVIEKAKRSLDAETYTAFESVLKGAAEKVKQGALFTELGSGSPVLKADTPQGRMEALAKAYAEKHSVTVAKAHSTLSKTDAEYRKAAQEEYDLYAARQRGGH